MATVFEAPMQLQYVVTQSCRGKHNCNRSSAHVPRLLKILKINEPNIVSESPQMVNHLEEQHFFPNFTTGTCFSEFYSKNLYCRSQRQTGFYIPSRLPTERSKISQPLPHLYKNFQMVCVFIRCSFSHETKKSLKFYLR